MKLRCVFEPVDMGNEIIAVPVGNGAKEVHGVLKLNKEAQEILALLEKDTKEEDIVNCLVEKYKSNRQVIEKYVNKVLVVLRKADLLEE